AHFYLIISRRQDTFARLFSCRPHSSSLPLQTSRSIAHHSSHLINILTTSLDSPRCVPAPSPFWPWPPSLWVTDCSTLIPITHRRFTDGSPSRNATTVTVRETTTVAPPKQTSLALPNPSS